MPGIAGLITKMPRERAVALLSRMVKTLHHESFYETGTWVEESLGVYVGWAVRKGSFCDGLPITNERGDVSLVFSGEEYSDPRSSGSLKEPARSLDARRSSYLLRLYEERQDFPASLNGLFHGLVADRTRGSAILFNDRYGMHKLCYHESKEAFCFAAEAKAILAIHPELRMADPQSLGDFVACSCVLENRTLFKDIRVLPGASVWYFRGGEIERKSTYFRPSEWEAMAPMDSEPYYSEVQNTISRQLPLYFRGDEPVGMTLTGGFDTRIIMAWHQPTSGSLPCYTFGSMFRESQDVRVARRIADVCHQSYDVITVGDEFLSRFPHYAERTMYLTEGGVDVYRSSDLFVSEKARQIAPAKVVGTYGSEIVRHAVMFKPMPPPEGMFQPEFLPNVDRARDTYAELRREHPVTFAAFRQSPWYHQGVLALESSQLTVRSPYLDNDFVRAIFRSPKSDRLNGDIRPRLIRDGSPALASIRTDRGAGGESGRLMSSAARGLHEFTFKAEYAYDYGMPQWLARIDHSLSPLHLEKLFLGRHKLSHYRVWYRDVLAGYVRDMLLDERTLSRPYLQRKGVEAIVNGHTKQGLNYTSAIHKLLSLELLQRLFMDSRS
jgi:asparagine synthase (glutamine-hydrolysing)